MDKEENKLINIIGDDAEIYKPETTICRICFEPIVLRTYDLRGCDCIVKCHDKCIDKWFLHIGKEICPICHKQIQNLTKEEEDKKKYLYETIFLDEPSPNCGTCCFVTSLALAIYGVFF